MASVNNSDRLQQEVLSSLVDERLSCPVAFKIADKLQVSPKDVGDKADELGTRIMNCQLGCFGVSKAMHEELKGQPIDEQVSAEIKSNLPSSGYLSCLSAWNTAEKLRVSRKKVGDTASQLKLRIVDCQLGCF